MRAQDRKLVEAEEASRAEAKNVNAENETGSVETEKEAGATESTDKVVIENLIEFGSDAKPEDNFTCDFCGINFSSLRAIRTHQGKKHKVAHLSHRLMELSMKKSFTPLSLTSIRKT
jgi:hypothetical protein